MNNITIDKNTITLQYKDFRGNEIKLSADLQKYSTLFPRVAAFRDKTRIVDKTAFDKEDLKIYRAVVENVYEELGNYYFAVLRKESPSQDGIKKALQTYLDLWGKDFIADSTFVMAMIPFVGKYMNEHTTVVDEYGWHDEVHKVFKQSGTANSFGANIERMFYDLSTGGTFKTFAQVRAEKEAKKAAKKAAKQAAKEAAEAKNVQA